MWEELAGGQRFVSGDRGMCRRVFCDPGRNVGERKRNSGGVGLGRIRSSDTETVSGGALKRSGTEDGDDGAAAQSQREALVASLRKNFGRLSGRQQGRAVVI